MKAIKYFSFGIASMLAFSACSDKFLQEKKNYDQVGAEVYNDYDGANGRLNDLYGWCLPTTSTMSWKYPACGLSDIASQSTEEYAGFSDFVNPENIMSSDNSTSTSVPDFFMGTSNNIQEAVYGRIRNINDFLRGIETSSLTETQKGVLMGQAYFFRAWCYYNLVKWYGGVPLVKEVLEPVESNYTPRSTTKETIEFILEDLDAAATLLADETTDGGWRDGSDYGRVTSGTALALKGRVLLLWASPIFNRANDKSRWTEAYNEMKDDLSIINACGYGLYTSSDDVNGSTFAKVFTQIGKTNNREAVFFTLYNTTAILTGIDDAAKNNTWERMIRPDNTGGNGPSPSRMILNLFPMADGKIPAAADNYTKLKTSDIALDTDYPFMNRDPRFYRTFAFPGFRWAYNGDASIHDAHNPSDGANYTLWSYVWYTESSQQGNPESGNSYGADNLGAGGTYGNSILVRKKSDDLDVNGSPLYSYNASGWKSGAGPFYSAAPLIELRYAEVLLNLAEAACGAGDVSAALGYLNQVRQRAGVPDRTTADFIGDEQAACMSAILYERQIEFAYEGKRFDDMRRWMLFDGGEGQATLKSSWAVTGWGGNTCTWLGFKPLNGQRREKLQYRTADKYGLGTAQWDGDPLLKGGGVRPAGINFNSTTLADDLANLKTWYQENLAVKEQKGDGYDSQKNKLYIKFQPFYYLLGFNSGVQNQNKQLEQTIGWGDYNKGGAPGTFDPLAE